MDISRHMWRPIDRIGCHLFGDHFVGGKSVQDVLHHGEQLKRKGYAVSYNLLGEHVYRPEIVSYAVETNLSLIDSMTPLNSGNVSVKPTLFGLDISQDLFEENLKKNLDKAVSAQIEIEVDAESFDTIPATFRVFQKFASDPLYFPFIRQAVQAHLRGIFHLMTEYELWDKKLRIVKGSGVYPESSDIVVGDPAGLIEQYLEILAKNLINSSEDVIPFVATVRDKKLAARAKEILDDHGRGEFEMLYGLIGKGLAKSLRNEGWTVRIYIPFVADWCKDAWKPYGLRRAEMMRHLMWEEFKDKFKK